MRKQFTFIVSIFLILLSINLVYAAAPNKFWGIVTVNGAPIDWASIEVYNSTGVEIFDNPSYGLNPPIGNYVIDVFCVNGVLISFKSGTLIFNEQNKPCVEGGVTNLDLTATDADNDGYSSVNDCDDSDNQTYPGAPELCDGKDNDCDGLTDEDENNLANNNLTRNFYSGPSETLGIGRCTAGIEVCTLNTTNITYYWNATVSEVVPGLDSDCNGIDENCDGGDYCPAPPAPSGGGGGGGGGGGCTPQWTCTDWSECASSSTQTRTCTDSKDCGTTTNKPAESQSCTYVPPAPATTAPTGGEEITQTPTTPTPGITGMATGIAGITGAFIGTPARALGSSLILLALILAVIILVAAKKKKKK